LDVRDPLDLLDADAARTWIASAAAELERRRGAIDDINVFPVPDGDTGTNLAATFAAAAYEAERSDAANAAEVLKAAAHAAVLNARGNSGVIASQFLRSFAENVGAGDPAGVRAALAAAPALAETAVAEPRAGTMLSVMQAAADPDGDSLGAVLADAVTRATTALAHTPEQLPELARAGVVDAGGQGLLIVLECLAATVSGATVSSVTARAPRSARALKMAREGGSPEFEFEVQYLLESRVDDAEGLRSELAAMGDSVVVVGTGTGTWNVHAHVNDVGAAIEAGIDRGRVRRLSVVHFLDQESDDDEVVLVALAPPDGLDELFESEGVVVLRDGDLRTAIGAARRVVLLPPAGVAGVDAMVAETRLGGTEIAVVPTRSPLQALAAIAVHDQHRRFQDDVIAMAEAAAATRFAEIRVAEDDALTTVGPCRRGDVLGLIDGEVVHIGSSLDAVALLVTDRLLGTGGELITVLAGSAAPMGAGPAISAHVAERAPFTEVVVYETGQRDCPLMIGME
jgi:DAK2 domain fusion protein YloV